MDFHDFFGRMLHWHRINQPTEDYFLPWIIGSVLRLIRMTSVVFSIFATPLYVAVMTYHGQGISNIFLPTIISSRINVPFPPFVEVLIMELVIELLREAGARLPSKIGQTIGIVGGIVLGTAAVEASITSNFLLIIVALAALASFTSPVFRMSATIRVLRFPFIIAAQIGGILGIFIFILFVIIHLLRLILRKWASRNKICLTPLGSYLIHWE